MGDIVIYRHEWADGAPTSLPVGKVLCVARNYLAHARELGNPVPEAPVLFMKPPSAIVPLREPLTLPAGDGPVHHETELAVLLVAPLKDAGRDAAQAAIGGYGIGLDLTLRELQQELKQRGYPWERAKAFDGACPLSPFVRPDALGNPSSVRLTLAINGEVRQDGSTEDMITPTVELIAYASRFFTLLPGDVVLTGTPPGVGPLASGDRLRLELDGQFCWETRVA